MSPPPRIAVIGLGHLLMGDDGAGLRALAELQKAELPPNVELRELGTPGLGLTSYIDGYDVVIFVDAAHDSGPPGSVRVYRYEELLALPAQPRLSPHDPAVKDALLLAELAGTAPRDALLVGVVPGNCSLHIGLTEAVEAAIPGVVRAVQTAIASSLVLRV